MLQEEGRPCSGVLFLVQAPNPKHGQLPAIGGRRGVALGGEVCLSQTGAYRGFPSAVGWVQRKDLEERGKGGREEREREGQGQNDGRGPPTRAS